MRYYRAPLNRCLIGTIFRLIGHVQGNPIRVGADSTGATPAPHKLLALLLEHLDHSLFESKAIEEHKYDSAPDEPVLRHL